MPDALGHFLRLTPSFPKKWRLLKRWEKSYPQPKYRIAKLPGGNRCHVDLSIPYERMVWLQREEWDELLFLRKLLQENDLLIDVGANIGLWSLVGADLAKVIAIEPNPTTFNKLAENVKFNGLHDQVTLVNKAVSDRSKRVVFQCMAEHNTSGISEHADGGMELEAIALDDLLSGIPTESKIVIKVDTEGHEMESLAGATKLIEAFRPILILEFNTTLISSSQLTDWAPFRFLQLLGYTAYIYNRSSETRIDHLEVNGYQNILFRPA